MKKIIIGLSVIAALTVLGCSFFYDTDNIRISKRIFYNSERKDILDYNGKYEIPPEVLSYRKVDDFILIKWKPEFPLDAIYDKYDYNRLSYSLDSLRCLFWVIDLKNEVQFGPVDSIAFEAYCSSRRIGLI